MSYDPDMVSVRITGSVTMYFTQTVQISREKFDELNELYSCEDGLGVDDAEQFLVHLDLTEPESVEYDDVMDFERVEDEDGD